MTRHVAPGAWLVAACALLAAGAPTASAKPRERAHHSAVLAHAEGSRAAFGATGRVELDGRMRASTERARDAVLDEFERLGALLDRDAPGGELARLSANAFEARVPCSSELWSALQTALALARETDGAYDPTAAPLTRAWDEAATARPDPAALARARVSSGWTLVQLEPGTRAVRFPRPGMGLDLDGVARGVALDRAVDSLRAYGVRRARLALGEVRSVFADEGSGWELPVSYPGQSDRPLLSLTARQAAVAQVDARARTIDPRTGLLIYTTATVAVITRSAARAQGLARAFQVMGRESTSEFAASHRDIGVLWLEPDGSTLNAWRWNLPPLTLAPAEVVHWMD